MTVGITSYETSPNSEKSTMHAGLYQPKGTLLSPRLICTGLLPARHCSKPFVNISSSDPIATPFRRGFSAPFKMKGKGRSSRRTKRHREYNGKDYAGRNEQTHLSGIL